MAFTVKREPDSLTREFHGLLEHCAFCRKPTAYWYEPKDVAVCPDCAKTHTVQDVPTKKQWWERQVPPKPKVPVYSISFEMLQDLFDGGVETAGMGRSDGIQFYLAQIAREHQFYKEHSQHAEG